MLPDVEKAQLEILDLQAELEFEKHVAEFYALQLGVHGFVSSPARILFLSSFSAHLSCVPLNPLS